MAEKIELEFPPVRGKLDISLAEVRVFCPAVRRTLTRRWCSSFVGLVVSVKLGVNHLLQKRVEKGMFGRSTMARFDGP